MAVRSPAAVALRAGVDRSGPSAVHLGDRFNRAELLEWATARNIARGARIHVQAHGVQPLNDM